MHKLTTAYVKFPQDLMTKN